MARYMGGPRCRREQFRRRPTLCPPGTFRRRANKDEEDDEDWEESEDEIPDSDDIGSSSQVDYGGSSQEQPAVLKGKNGNGAAYNDGDGSDRDSDNESSTLGSGFEYPFPGLHGREPTNNAVNNNNEPRLKRARSMSIPIRYPNPFSLGMLTYKPPPLPINYGWMVRGTAAHVEDLHLSGIPVCSRPVRSKTQIEVLGEYTWIETTPSQEETYERFPAIYVPGNARTWRSVLIDSSLRQEDVQSMVNQKIRDDNAHRQPRYPYEPALRALEASGKVASLSGIDIVTDADTLTQLLSFIMGDAAPRRVKEPFRLELKTVRGTLFVHPSHKPGSSQAGPPSKKTRHDPAISPPDWAPGVLGHMATRAAALPYSGGHYRLVRYRFGSVVLAVRVKVDFAYQHRKGPRHAESDPLGDVQPVFLPRREGDVAQTWKTTVVREGLGTRPAAAGVASVRYAWQDKKTKIKALLPQLWFSRTPFVVDCGVSYPDLAVREASLVNSRQWYASFERGYENSLRRLAGLLRHLQGRTREMGGDIVLIADPAPVYFVLLKPVIAMQALPEDLVLKFWGPDAEVDEEGRRLAEMGRDSTPEEAEAPSDLTDLSSTPSLPSGSEIPNVVHGQSEQSQPATPQLDQPQASSEEAPADIPGGSANTAGAQSSEENDPIKMVTDWNNNVETPVRQSVEDGGATGYAATPAYNLESSLDGNRSSSQGSLMVGESAQEAGSEGADRVLNSLALQMNRPGVKQDSHESLVAVARAQDVEVLRGQHSLLMVDRHLTSGMHSSSDDEWPPRPPVHPHGRITNNSAPDMLRPPRHAHGDMELRSIRSDSLILTAETPPGPYNADVDSAGHVVPRVGSRRGARGADSDYDDDEEEEDEEPSPPRRRRQHSFPRRMRLSDQRPRQQNYIKVSNDGDVEDEEDEMAEDEMELDDDHIEDDNNDGADDEGAWD